MKQNPQFGVNPVPFHTHNGIDSPVIKQPIYTYIGQVNDDGSPGPLFPPKWTVSRDSNSNYIIVHNLGTTKYSFFATSITNVAIPVFSSFFGNNTSTKNRAWMAWYDHTGSKYHTAFMFIIVVGQYNATNNTQSP